MVRDITHPIPLQESPVLLCRDNRKPRSGSPSCVSPWRRLTGKRPQRQVSLGRSKARNLSWQPSGTCSHDPPPPRRDIAHPCRYRYHPQPQPLTPPSNLGHPAKPPSRTPASPFTHSPTHATGPALRYLYRSPVCFRRLALDLADYAGPPHLRGRHQTGDTRIWPTAP